MGASIMRFGMMGISSIVIPLLKKYFGKNAKKNTETKAKKSSASVENYTSQVNDALEVGMKSGLEK